MTMENLAFWRCIYLLLKMVIFQLYIGMLVFEGVYLHFSLTLHKACCFGWCFNPAWPKMKIYRTNENPWNKSLVVTMLSYTSSHNHSSVKNGSFPRLVTCNKYSHFWLRLWEKVLWLSGLIRLAFPHFFPAWQIHSTPGPAIFLRQQRVKKKQM